MYHIQTCWHANVNFCRQIALVLAHPLIYNRSHAMWHVANDSGLSVDQKWVWNLYINIDDSSTVAATESRFLYIRTLRLILKYHLSHTQIVVYDLQSGLWCFLSKLSTILPVPGPWFNVKIPSWQYRKFHCGDKTISQPSHLHNEISNTGKTTSLYWIRLLVAMIDAMGWTDVFSFLMICFYQNVLPLMLQSRIQKTCFSHVLFEPYLS